MKRRKTRTVKVRGLAIGSAAPVLVQTMTKVPAEDVSKTVKQIHKLRDAGAQIVRLAVPNHKSLDAFEKIREKTDVALVADIHFDWRLALGTLERGADKIRLNPGNITDKKGLKKVILEAQKRNVPIRIGVNSGSVRTKSKKKGSEVSAGEMVTAAKRYIRFFENLDFNDIVISMKTSSVITTIESYRLLADECDYPFHLGVTAAGPPEDSLIKSSIGIGGLLVMGLGDTIRVSMTASPIVEVHAAYDILRAIGYCKDKVEILSCPTCGRCQVDIAKIASSVKKKLQDLDASMKVAVMGCVVNGPGEAEECDIGLAGGKGFGFLFKKGKKIRKVNGNEMVQVLVDEARKLAKEKGRNS